MGKRKRRGRGNRAKGARGRSQGGQKEPTLFDLPLRPTDDKSKAAVTTADASSASSPTTGSGPSILFDDPKFGGDRPSLLEAKELATGVEEKPREKPQAAKAPKPEAPAGSGALDLGASDLGVGASNLGTLDLGPSSNLGNSSDRETKPATLESDGTETSSGTAFLGDRFLGGLADLAAHLISLGLTIAAIHAMGIVVTATDWMPFGILMLVYSFLYCNIPLAFWGQTPGMAWVGHTARSMSDEPLSFGQTFRRWLGSILTLALVGLPLLMALNGRSLTDLVSGSRTTANG